MDAEQIVLEGMRATIRREEDRLQALRQSMDLVCARMYADRIDLIGQLREMSNECRVIMERLAFAEELYVTTVFAFLASHFQDPEQHLTLVTTIAA